VTGANEQNLLRQGFGGQEIAKLAKPEACVAKGRVGGAGVEEWRVALEGLYAAYSDRGFAARDPVSALYSYDRLEDREVVGLLAAGLAYGRVASILKSLEEVRARLGETPAHFVCDATNDTLRRTFRGFQHRWTRAEDVVSLLAGVREVSREWGSLGAAFGTVSGEEATVQEALARWVGLLRRGHAGRNSLLADPAAGSACKRLFLYLRWMVRMDAVDPGGWPHVSPARLIVPVDVHMHRVGQALGFTRRKQADLATALEITDGFRRIVPEDPVRFDFVLTRPGILSAIDVRSLGKNGKLDPEAMARMAPRHMRLDDSAAKE
jgi:uncharacterized protein (TIGR02757 family)